MGDVLPVNFTRRPIRGMDLPRGNPEIWVGPWQRPDIEDRRAQERLHTLRMLGLCLIGAFCCVLGALARGHR